ncbi:MAG TPA: nucleotidyltransferase [Thermoanaerobacterales bacterium]|nr:nucleotidyltransferase [Thermoanaerobacterales bacterium]
MNVIGVIAEYNPFHKGHLYQLNTVRKVLKPDGIIVILSGNFVQRGEPAVFDKWARAEMALHGGADLVIELPVCFSTATAEIFAESAVKLLSQTQIVNTLSFGIEEYHEKELFYLGKLLSEEPILLKKLIKDYLKTGVSFPSAREKAVAKYISSKNENLNVQLISKLLKKPNFILAVEYIKAIVKLGVKFSIFPVLRKGHGYHDKEFTEQYASASGIRQALFFHGLDISNGIIKSLPDSTLRIMKREIESNRTPVFLQDYETIILYVLRRMQPRELTAYFDVEEGLENRIKKSAQFGGNLDQLISRIVSKRYPETRIQRILTHILLNIPKEMIESRTPQYFRVLGFTQRGSLILRELNKKTTVPIISRAAEYKNLNHSAKKMFEKDLLSSDVYSLAFKDPTPRNGSSDFSRRVIYFNPLK